MTYNYVFIFSRYYMFAFKKSNDYYYGISYIIFLALKFILSEPLKRSSFECNRNFIYQFITFGLYLIYHFCYKTNFISFKTQELKNIIR